jgi:hypothetical protein
MRLPTPTRGFKVKCIDTFMNANRYGVYIWRKWLAHITTHNVMTFQIDIADLIEIYQEVAWIFTRIVGQESSLKVPRYFLCVMHYVINKDEVFD